MPRRITRRTLLGTAAAVGAAGALGTPHPSEARTRDLSGLRPGDRPVPQLAPRGEYLVRNAWVLSMDPAIGDLERGDVHVRNGEIVAVGTDLVAPGAEVIEAWGMIALPGFVDTHWHMWNNCIRNLCGDGPERGYFAVDLTLGNAYTPEDSYRGVRLAAAEALFAGITTVLSFAHNVRSPAHADAELRALTDTGIRALFAYGHPHGHPANQPMDRADLARVQRDLAAGLGEGLVTLGMASRNHNAISPVHAAEPAIVRGDWDYARTLGVPITLHASRPGIAELLASWLGPDVQFVHGNFATEVDRAILAETGTHMSVNPVSDLRWLPAFAPVREMLDAGILTSVGFDSAGISGGADMFNAMRTIALVERTRLDDVTWPEPRLVLELATIDGARDLWLADRIGSLTPGKRADLILVRSTDLNMAPLVDAYNALVFCAQPHNVDTVMVDGRIVKRGGELLLDTERIAAEAAESVAGLRARTGGVF